MQPIIKNKKFYKELRKRHINILDPYNTCVSPEAKLERTITIHSGVQILGNTEIGYLSVIGPNTTIKNSEIWRNVKIGSGCQIRNSIIENACEIGNKCKIGPLSHLRPKTFLEEKVVIGNFVEIKNSTIGKNTKIKHHAYIGNAEIGKNVNIGAGTKIANSDGKKKHETIIKNNAYIGINVSLIAPVIIGEEAYVSAGSVITKNVPPDALAFGRARQINKLYRGKRRYRPKNGSKN